MTATTRRPGRPPVGDMVHLRMPGDLVQRIDRVAQETGGTRSETIRRLLVEQLTSTERTRTMTETETQRCRVCGAEVAITRDEAGLVEQTDGSGDVVCDQCWQEREGARS